MRMKFVCLIKTLEQCGVLFGGDAFVICVLFFHTYTIIATENCN